MREDNSQLYDQALSVADAIEKLPDSFVDENLQLQAQSISKKDFKEFVDALGKNQSITELNLKSCRLTGEHVEKLTKAIKNKRIKKLNLSNNNEFLLKGMKAIASFMIENQTVVELDLSNNGFGRKCSIQIARILKRNITLQKLKLGKNRIGDSASHLRLIVNALTQNTSLTELDLSDNNMGPLCSIQIGLLLQNNQWMTSLDLSGNHFGVEPLKTIAKGLKANYSLTVLNLDRQQKFLGKPGAEIIINALQKNRSLTQITYKENIIPDEQDKEIVKHLNENIRLNLKSELLYLYQKGLLDGKNQQKILLFKDTLENILQINFSFFNNTNVNPDMIPAISHNSDSYSGIFAPAIKFVESKFIKMGENLLKSQNNELGVYTLSKNQLIIFKNLITKNKNVENVATILAEEATDICWVAITDLSITKDGLLRFAGQISFRILFYISQMDLSQNKQSHPEEHLKEIARKGVYYQLKDNNVTSMDGLILKRDVNGDNETITLNELLKKTSENHDQFKPKASSSVSSEIDEDKEIEEHKETPSDEKREDANKLIPNDSPNHSSAPTNSSSSTNCGIC